MPELILRQALIAVYGAVALCALAARWRSDGRERIAWSVVSALLLLLGVAKWFHVQEGLTDTARKLLLSKGWYAEHREVQTAAAAAIAFGAALLAIGTGRWLRRVAPSVITACAALGLLLGFVAIRTASIHAVDLWVTAPFAGMRKGWWVELAALLVIAGSALACSARRAVRR